MTYKPGIYSGVKNADYHRDPALGSTSLKTLATKTPAHYQWDKSHPKSSTAFDIGTATHSLILEQDESGVVVIDVEAKRGKAWTEPADEATAAGKIALTAKEWVQIKAMRDAVMAHPLARAAFTDHKAEESVFWDEGGQTYKCRPDAWKPGLLVDLKTTINADPREFGRTAFNLGYHQSAAHYQDGVLAATGELLPFVFVLVEKQAPYLVSVVQLDDEALGAGASLNAMAKGTYKRCVETGVWPGYESNEPITLPYWGIRQIEELTA